jgi:hypothetical protein
MTEGGPQFIGNTSHHNGAMGQDNAEKARGKEICDFPCMSHASDIFPSRVHDKLFQTDRGDVCLYLHEAWPSLLGDLSLLGPSVLISKNEQLALVSICRKLEFVPVPGGTEMLDLSSALCVETANLGSVIAGQEAHTGNLTLHFFDWNQRALFKVILAPGSDIEAFVHLASHYGKVPTSSRAQPFRLPRDEPSGAVLAEEKMAFQNQWSTYSPELGGDFLPGGSVRWLDALRLAGRERSLFLTKVGLVKAILAAHHDKLRLRMTSWREGLHHETTVVPYRIERCGHCFHLFDVESEAHFFFESDMDIWVGYHGRERLPAIHLFSATGERRGLIQFDGKPEESETWVEALSSDFARE